jgi:hypothetical protein
LYRFFSDIFGDEAGLDRTQALENFNIKEDPYQETAAEEAPAEEAGEVVLPADTTVEDTGLNYLDYLQQVREASLGLEPDADLMGTKDVFIQIEEDETPFFEPEQPERPEPEIPEVEEVGYEVTEPEVTFEEPAAGGGAEAAPQPQPEPEPQLEPQPQPSGGDQPMPDQEAEETFLQHAWEYLGNGVFRNIITGEEVIETQGDYVVGEVYSRGDETPVTDVGPQEEEPEEDISLIEEIFTLPLPASDMVDVIIDDTVTPPEPPPVTQPTEIPTTPTTPVETTVETPVETPAAGQEQAGEAGQAGTDTGQVGTGQAGADGGEGGLGGLGGLGMFAGLGEPPGEFTQPEPFKRVSLGYRPVQMERARLFDYMNYNPLRNIR